MRRHKSGLVRGAGMESMDSGHPNSFWPAVRIGESGLIWNWKRQRGELEALR